MLVRCLNKAAQRPLAAAFNSWRTTVVLAKLMADMGNDDDDEEEDDDEENGRGVKSTAAESSGPKATL